MQTSFGLETVGDSLAGRIDKYMGKFLTGEWLEIFFWELLNIHAVALEIDSVHLGVEVKQQDSAALTDFDVAFMRRQALGVIECKSGAQEQEDDPNAPLDKLEARIQQIRSLRVNPVLVTTSAKILDQDGQLKQNLADRARIYNCRIVTVHQAQDLARCSDSAEKLDATLFGK
jgi:hypothetical protein